MGDLTRNYSRYEFACKDNCGFDSIDFETLTILQKVHDYLEEKTGQIISGKVNSGSRCVAHNSSEDVQGSDRSQHLFSRGVDIKFKIKATGKAVPPKLVYQVIELFLDGKGGLAEYETFTHFDTRGGTPWRKRL